MASKGSSDRSRIIVRPSVMGEAEVLTELAMRSKAYWPYSKEFVEKCRDDLTVTAERVGRGHFFSVFPGSKSAKNSSNPIGLFAYALGNSQENEVELTHFFLDPEWIGQGMGRAMWEFALDHARVCGWASFFLIADPYASERFYVPMGCEVIGEIESTVEPGRILPKLRYFLQ